MKQFYLHFTISVVLSIANITMYAQHTEVASPHIHTVQVIANDDYKLPAIIKLGSEEHIEISFDHLTHNYHRFRYTLTHCDADWNTSNISESEYLDGFNDNPIEDSEISINTTLPYTHYKFSIPNDEVRIKLSGNYRITIYDEDEYEDGSKEKDTPAFSTCFRVLDKQVNISAQVSSDTDIDRNKAHQQASFTIQHKGYTIRNAQDEIKVYVIQNNNFHNQASHIKPSYIGYEQLRYEHNRDLIFPAGNEFRRFEMVSTKYASRGVESIRYHNPYYHVTLSTDTPRTGNYSYDQDQNGRFVIRNENATNSNTEADYFFVHFALSGVSRLTNGNIYLQGDFTNNGFGEENRLKYNEDRHAYEVCKLLKQGAYNYQYVEVSPYESDTSSTEGNYYETENEYLILVYHRAFGERYDQLIGMGLVLYK